MRGIVHGPCPVRCHGTHSVAVSVDLLCFVFVDLQLEWCAAAGVHMRYIVQCSSHERERVFDPLHGLAMILERSARMSHACHAFLPALTAQRGESFVVSIVESSRPQHSLQGGWLLVSGLPSSSSLINAITVVCFILCATCH